MTRTKLMYILFTPGLFVVAGLYVNFENQLAAPKPDARFPAGIESSVAKEEEANFEEMEENSVGLDAQSAADGKKEIDYCEAFDSPFMSRVGMAMVAMPEATVIIVHFKDKTKSTNRGIRQFQFKQWEQLGCPNTFKQVADSGDRANT